MPTDTSVKFFQNTMSGAPSNPKADGALMSLLDACLVNGFGSVILNSLVIADNVATGTVSTGHGFAMTGATGPVIRIEGATPSGLNGDWRIQTVPSSTTFTFSTSGISNQTATGTVTAKRAPAGFEKVFSGTNTAVYRSLDVQSTRLYLRVDDTANQYQSFYNFARVQMFSTMSDVDTGTAITANLYQMKYNNNTPANTTWRVYADDRAFYLLAETEYYYATPLTSVLFFGDLAYPAVPADAGHCGLTGTANQDGRCTMPNMANDGYLRLATSYNGSTLDVAASRKGHAFNYVSNVNGHYYIGNGGASFVAAIGVLAKAVEVFEADSVYRGLMPGWYTQVHGNSTAWKDQFVEHATIGTLRGDQMYSGSGGTQFQQLFDITGPWR